MLLDTLRVRLFSLSLNFYLNSQILDNGTGTNRNFESVALIFLERNEWNALYEYISRVLYLRTKPSHKIQNILLCTWIVEISMRRRKDDDDDDDNKYEELRKFLSEQHERGNLNEDIIMSLLRSDGRSDLVLYFASLLEKHEYAISYLVSRGQYVVFEHQARELFHHFTL